MDNDDLRGMDLLRFLTAPEDAGQAVEVSYAGGSDRMFRRTHDRSDRSTSYAVAQILARDWQWYETWEACNGAPPIPRSRWRRISAEAIARYARRADGEAW